MLAQARQTASSYKGCIDLFEPTTLRMRPCSNHEQDSPARKSEMQTSARELACFETNRPVHTTDGMYPHISPRTTTLPTSTSTPQPLLAEVAIGMRLRRRELRQRKRNRRKGNRRFLDHVASTRGWNVTLKAFGSPTIVASFCCAILLYSMSIVAGHCWSPCLSVIGVHFFGVGLHVCSFIATGRSLSQYKCFGAR